MTTHRIKGFMAFVCDSCDETLETGERSFPEANKSRAESDWAARKGRGETEWSHYCPDCKDRPALGRAG